MRFHTTRSRALALTVVGFLVVAGASYPIVAQELVLFSDDFEAGLDPSVWHLEVINGAQWIHATDAAGGHATALAQSPRNRNNRFADMLTQQEFSDFTLTWDMRFLNDSFHQDRRLIYFRSDGQPVPHGYHFHTAVGYPFGPDWLQLDKLNPDGSSQNLHPQIEPPWVLHQWFSFKLVVHGNVFKLKFWEKGEPEPESWAIEAEDPDSTYSTGRIGFGNYWSASTDVDNVTVSALDSDGDGIPDSSDDCPFDPDNDIDGDDVCGDVDNCPDDANPDQADFNGDGVGDTCTPCDPDPRSQGYWFRQCLGVPLAEGGIDPGRNGRGPLEPLEAGFDKSMDAVSLLLEDFFEFGGACAGGMDADPPSDQCEKALKQTTALLFNLATSKLSGSCPVDLSAQSCSSTNLTGLVGELEGLINSGDEGNCRTATACAAAVNEGSILVESAPVMVEAPGPSEVPEPLKAARVSGRVASWATRSEGLPAETASREPAAAPAPIPAVVFGVPLVGEAGVDAAQEEAAGGSPAVPEEDLHILERHLAVVANLSAPESAVDVSADALLTALSGGYGPEVRLKIVRGVLPRIDVAFEALLVGHLEEIRAEAEDTGEADLAEAAARLLERLRPSEE